MNFLRRIALRMLSPLAGGFNPCHSSREGFPTYPRREDPLIRSQYDLIYCELIRGHAGKHLGTNPQNGQVWFWREDRTPIKNEEIKEGVVYYSIHDYWDGKFPELDK